MKHCKNYQKQKGRICENNKQMIICEHMTP